MVLERRALGAREIDHERLWLSIALASAALVVFWIASGHEELPRVICPFRAITGIPCLSCGGTRALLALAHGDVRAALVWNPLVALGAIAGAAWLLYAAVVILLQTPRLRLRLDTRDRLAVRLAAGFVLVGNWIFVIAQGR